MEKSTAIYVCPKSFLSNEKYTPVLLVLCIFISIPSLMYTRWIHVSKNGTSYISTIVFCQEEGKQHGQEFMSATPT